MKSEIPSLADPAADPLTALEVARDTRKAWLQRQANLDAALDAVRAAHMPKIVAARAAYNEAARVVILLAEQQDEVAA
jgi:hypothetical protein